MASRLPWPGSRKRRSNPKDHNRYMERVPLGMVLPLLALLAALAGVALR
jgi:hypothetical protein